MLFIDCFWLFFSYLFAIMFFRFFLFKNILGIIFWSKFWHLIEEFSINFLSMPIYNQLWHTRVGLFNNRLNKRNKTIFPLYLSSDLSKRLTCILSLNLRSAYQLVILTNISCLTLFVHPKFSFTEVGRYWIKARTWQEFKLKFCHWNLNGLGAHEFTKLSLFEGCINVSDIDIICLLETFLDSSVPIDDNRLSIPGYSMMRADHPSNTKRGGVCLYYKEHLPIIRRDDISNLQKCLVTEITA